MHRIGEAGKRRLKGLVWHYGLRIPASFKLYGIHVVDSHGFMLLLASARKALCCSLGAAPLSKKKERLHCVE
jgi:hypothetical protein